MPQSTPAHDSPQEQTRRLENLARLGTVVAVQHSQPPRCRVQLGENTTTWIPWLAGRAAGPQGSQWWPPAVGEQCMVIAPGGDLAQGVALLGAYSDRMAAPSNARDAARVQWSATDYAEHQSGKATVHTDSAIRLEVGAQCSVTLQPDAITLQVGSATLRITTGGITSSVDIAAQGISAVHHRHSGVRPGQALTEEPAA